MSNWSGESWFLFKSLSLRSSFLDVTKKILIKFKSLKFDISKKEKFRSYELIGTFTDEYGNYGKLEGIIISDIKDNKLIKLEGTAKTIYANNEVLYIKAFRKESDFDAGVATMEIVGASDKFKALIGTKCKQSVRYFKDTMFGLQKCKITKEQSEILKSN